VYPYYYGDYPYYGYDYDEPGYTVYGPLYSSDSDGGPVSVQVQRELARDGYYRGPIDGVVGPGTRAAIAAYQRDNGLRATGTINSHLLDSLDLD
jgi:peptidoglycan hydrolase-like protein with peptidoglycan-binding domain